MALVLMVAGKVNNWAFDTVPQKGLNGRIGQNGGQVVRGGHVVEGTGHLLSPSQVTVDDRDQLRSGRLESVADQVRPPVTRADDGYADRIGGCLCLRHNTFHFRSDRSDQVADYCRG